MWSPEIDADRLLDFLRHSLAAPGLRYAEAPSRIAGGLETFTYGLRLDGPAAPPTALVLRCFHPKAELTRPTFEATVQTTLADAGFPAPRPLLACADPQVLGSGFVVMERLPGIPLGRTLHRFKRAGRLLAETQLRLHSLDPEPLGQALAAHGLRLPTLSQRLEDLAGRIARASAGGLAQAVAWLREHRPREPERLSILHGDCNPANLLISRGRVTGLVDWAANNTVRADPAWEFAATRSMYSLVTVPRGFRWLTREILSSYTRRYCEERSFEPEVVRYYSLFPSVGLLLFVSEWRAGLHAIPAEHRLRGSRDWNREGELDPFIAYFRSHTGIELRI